MGQAQPIKHLLYSIKAIIPQTVAGNLKWASWLHFGSSWNLPYNKLQY